MSECCMNRCDTAAATSIKVVHKCHLFYMRFYRPSLPTAWWRLGVVVSVVGRINEVNQHRARLVHDGDHYVGKPSLTNHLGQLSLASLRGR